MQKKHGKNMHFGKITVFTAFDENHSFRDFRDFLLSLLMCYVDSETASETSLPSVRSAPALQQVASYSSTTSSSRQVPFLLIVCQFVMCE